MLASVTGWLCLLPTLMAGIFCTILGVISVCWFNSDDPPKSKDDKDSAGCCLLAGIFGVSILAAICFVLLVSR